MKFQEKFKNQLDTEAHAWIEKIDEELCKSIKSENNLNADSNSLVIYFRLITDVYVVYLGEHNDPNKVEIGRIRKSVLKKIIHHLRNEGFQIIEEQLAGKITCRYEVL